MEHAVTVPVELACAAVFQVVGEEQLVEVVLLGYLFLITVLPDQLLALNDL